MITNSNPDGCNEFQLHPQQVRLALTSLIAPATAARLAAAFQALADPTRARLISALLPTELCVCDLAAVLGMTQSAVSHQLRSLRDLRLVRTRREGRVIFYAIDDDHIRDLFQRGLEHITHSSLNQQP